MTIEGHRSHLAAGDGGSGGDPFVLERELMVREQLAARDIRDPDVLRAMRTVPRHEFVPEELRDRAYEDHPLPIGFGQTISQPYIVAFSTQAAEPGPSDRALDVGTGSGYQAAVLAELVDSVVSIEIVPFLAESARIRLASLGYRSIEVHEADGYRGWPERAPFDLIVAAAAPEEVPPALIEQLAPGGRLVLPVGDVHQRLVVIHKDAAGGIRTRPLLPVRFVPMTGGGGKADSTPA